MIQAEQLHARILEELDLSRDIPDEELTELIHRVLDEASGREYIPLGKKAELGRELFNAFRKFDLLQEFLEDDKITEIMINGTENIFLEKEGKLIRSGKRFVSREKLEDVIQQIVAGSNRIVNEASPIVDARLPDGSRVNVVLGPIALNGPIVTIRKFPKEAITMKQLIRWGSICREVKEFLVKLVRAGYNIFISGGTGSGKTTFLNALSQYIPKDERIITIETKTHFLWFLVRCGFPLEQRGCRSFYCSVLKLLFRVYFNFKLKSNTKGVYCIIYSMVLSLNITSTLEIRYIRI